MKSFTKFGFIALASALISACGGGGGGGTTATTSTPVTSTATAVVTSTSTAVVTTPVVGATPVYTLSNPPSSSYAVGSAQRAMFNTINQIRLGGGFGALEQDTRLDQSAKAHADYIVDVYFPNGVQADVFSTVQPDGWLTGHTEIQGVSGFTGTRPASRIAITGYQSVTTGEVLGALYGLKPGDEPDMTRCLSGLLNTVFHRAALLDTTYLDIGFGIGKPTVNKDGFILRSCVIDFASKMASPILTQGWSGNYPFDQQTAVPLTMVAEQPDPVPSSPVKGGPVNIQTANGQNLLVTSFVLRDAGGVAVNAKVLTRADTTFLRTNEAYLVPIGSLVANSSYVVTFSGTSNGTIINKSWTFKTAAN